MVICVRDERMPREGGQTSASFHEAQLARVAHEFKEAACEVLVGQQWDDA